METKPDKQQTVTRLALCVAVKQIIFNVLTMFKINVPEKM